MRFGCNGAGWGGAGDHVDRSTTSSGASRISKCSRSNATSRWKSLRAASNHPHPARCPRDRQSQRRSAPFSVTSQATSTTRETGCTTSRILFSRYCDCESQPNDIPLFECVSLSCTHNTTGQSALTQEPETGALPTTAQDTSVDDAGKTAKRIKGDYADEALGLQTTPAVLPAGSDQVDEDGMAAFLPGMMALMGQIHYNHLGTIVQRARKHGDKDGVSVRGGLVAFWVVAVAIGCGNGVGEVGWSTATGQRVSASAGVLVGLCMDASWLIGVARPLNRRLIRRPPLRPRQPPKWSKPWVSFISFTRFRLVRRRTSCLGGTSAEAGTEWAGSRVGKGDLCSECRGDMGGGES